MADLNNPSQWLVEKFKGCVFKSIRVILAAIVAPVVDYYLNCIFSFDLNFYILAVTLKAKLCRSLIYNTIKIVSTVNLVVVHKNLLLFMVI